MVFHQFLDSVQLPWVEATLPGELHGVEQELGFGAAGSDVNVCWLRALITKEIEAKTAYT